VATGNHFFLDAAVGALVGALAIVVAALLSDDFRFRQRSSVVT
jgi:hypothetical protein